MGGKGSGGLRVGAGRKPKPKHDVWLGGDAGKRHGTKAKPAAAPLELIPAPKDLPGPLQAAWNELAPHAAAARTLVPGTMHAFRDLVEAIVLKRMMLEEITSDGLTGTKVTLQMDESGGGLQNVEKKAHPLLTQYRGMLQRVEAGLLRFRLSPMGKELVSVEAPQDEWAEFDGPGSVS